MAEYIDKKLAIDLMRRSSYLSDGDLLEVNGNLAKAMIEAEPAADVATVVHGYWFIDERPESDRKVTCSVCEEPVFRYLDTIDWRPKYCPHCGAKMDGCEL